MISGARMTLDDLVIQLQAAHGDALLGVVVYGSTASDPNATRGHNVLVVVRTLDVRAMQAAGAITQAWLESGNAVLLTLTAAEWESSADVFAIEHADIAERNRVAYAAQGFALTERAAVDEADIRRQLEYELLALVLSVRAAIAAAGRDVKHQRSILAAQASRAVALMRAALRLAHRDAAGDADAVCTVAAELAGFDPAPFRAAMGHRRGAREIPKAEVGATLDGFHAGLSRLVSWVDAVGSAN